jgi:hypothetical protein
VAVQPLNLLRLPTEVLQLVLDMCGLGPPSMQVEKTVDEVLLDAKLLVTLLLVCRFMNRVICCSPKYWHRIVLSSRAHENSLNAIRTTLARAGTRTSFHLIVLWDPRLWTLTHDFHYLFDSEKLWDRVTRLSIQDNAKYTARSVQEIPDCSVDSGSLAFPSPLFTQIKHVRCIRRARIECNVHTINVHVAPPVMPSLEYLTLVLNPVPNEMPWYACAVYGQITAHLLTHLEIDMPSHVTDIYHLLTHCKSLKHLRWIAPDGRLDEYMGRVTVTLPELESIHVRHCGLTITIEVPKVQFVVWDVHGAHLDPSLDDFEGMTAGIYRNVNNVRALTVCRCTFDPLHDLFLDSWMLERFTLCPVDWWDPFPFQTLTVILREAREPLRLITLAVSTRFICKDDAQHICEAIALRPQVHTVCYVLGDFNHESVREAFEHVERQHPSQFTLVTGLDREEVERRLGCKSCPNDHLS